MSPRPEAVAAAAWWADKLATPAGHNVGRGAEESTALVNSVSALVQRQRSQAQIEAFREALAEEIERHVACRPCGSNGVPLLIARSSALDRAGWQACMAAAHAHLTQHKNGGRL